MKIIWIWIVKQAVFIYMCWGLHRIKSAIYRFIYQFKYRNVPVSTYPSIKALGLTIRPSLYSHDGWRELWDVSAYVGWSELVWTSKLPRPTHGFDCDKFALYEAAAINASISAGTLIDDCVEAYVLSAIWLNGWTPNGHAVCLIKFKDGTLKWMDYYQPYQQICKTPDEIAIDVVRDYGYPDGKLVCWVVQSVDLKTLTWG